MANKARTEGGAARPTIPGPSGRAAPSDSGVTGRMSFGRGDAVKCIWRAGLKEAGRVPGHAFAPMAACASEYTKEKK